LEEEKIGFDYPPPKANIVGLRV